VDLVIAKKEVAIATADAKPAKLNIQAKILTKLYSFTYSSREFILCDLYSRELHLSLNIPDVCSVSSSEFTQKNVITLIRTNKYSINVLK
jgi:hypothetical protein